jgi:hypothetical protein
VCHCIVRCSSTTSSMCCQPRTAASHCFAHLLTSSYSSYSSYCLSHLNCPRPFINSFLFLGPHLVAGQLSASTSRRLGSSIQAVHQVDLTSHFPSHLSVSSFPALVSCIFEFHFLLFRNRFLFRGSFIASLVITSFAFASLPEHSHLTFSSISD